MVQKLDITTAQGWQKIVRFNQTWKEELHELRAVQFKENIFAKFVKFSAKFGSLNV